MIKARPYQLEVASETSKKLLILAPRLGKTLISALRCKLYYPEFKILVITTKAVMLESTAPNYGGFTRDFRNLYGKSFEFEVYKKAKSHYNHIIVNNHPVHLKSILENENIDLSEYIIIIDEVHKVKAVGTFEGRGKKKKLKGKSGYYSRCLIHKAQDFILLTATPSSVGYVDYTNYLLMAREIDDVERYERNHYRYDTIRIGSMHVRQITGYYDIEIIEAHINNISYIINRDDPLVIKEMGDKPIHEDIKFNANNIKVKKILDEQVYINYLGEEVYFDNHMIKNVAIRKHSHDFDNLKSAKMEFIKSQYDLMGRVVVFYNYTEELYYLLESMELDKIDTRVIRGSSKVGFEYRKYNESEVKEDDKFILFVQYQAGSEGITLYHIANTLIQYSLPVKYSEYVQSLARIDGPIEGRYYPITSTYSLIDTRDNKIKNSLDKKKDYDISVDTI